MSRAHEPLLKQPTMATSSMTMTLPMSVLSAKPSVLNTDIIMMGRHLRMMSMIVPERHTAMRFLM